MALDPRFIFYLILNELIVFNISVISIYIDNLLFFTINFAIYVIRTNSYSYSIFREKKREENDNYKEEITIIEKKDW